MVLLKTNNILLALNSGDVSVLTFLEFSSAFHTIDQHLFFHRLQSLSGISGIVPSWLESYLTGRTHIVTVNGQSLRPAGVFFGVPQGSVLGHILFIIYSAPLCFLTEIHSVCNQSFADDTLLL